MGRRDMPTNTWASSHGKSHGKSGRGKRPGPRVSIPRPRMPRIPVPKIRAPRVSRPVSGVRTRSGRRWSGRTILAGVGAVLVVAVVAVGVVMLALRSSESGPSTTAAGSGTSSSVPAEPAPGAGASVSASSSPVADRGPRCAEGTKGNVTTGAGPGGQSSGPDVIKAFDYAYYVLRSGERARAVAVPGAVGSVQDLQKAIDALPQGTTHCLSITEQTPTTFAVVLTQTPPADNDPPVVYHQNITTVSTGDKTWISSIRNATNP